MDQEKLQLYQRRAAIMKAMGHPSRLMVVDALAKRPHCVCELTELIGGDISTISRHLSVLKNAGIIMDERRGVQIYYHLRTPCVMNFFDCVEAVLADSSEKEMCRA
jgi:ArsR family transcriptional regulator